MEQNTPPVRDITLDDIVTMRERLKALVPEWRSLIGMGLYLAECGKTEEEVKADEATHAEGLKRATARAKNIAYGIVRHNSHRRQFLLLAGPLVQEAEMAQAQALQAGKAGEPNTAIAA
jgi:hypothetical protein